MTTTLPKRLTRSRFFALAEALTTPHHLDRYLELVNPMATVTDLRAEIVDVAHSTADTVTMTLRPTWQWTGFEAGQFVQVGVVIDGVRQTRCYSPASSEHRSDGLFELTVKAQADGLVSQHLRRNARKGLVVSLVPASGSFRLPEARPDKVLLISGGSGITPVLSMLRTLVDEKFAGDITFLHYAYSESDVPYLDELRRISADNENVNLLLAYTDQDAGGDLYGFFGAEHLAAAAPWHRDGQTFLCGPPGLMRSVRELFRDNGIDDQLHTEEFVTTVEPADGDASGTVSFSASGVTADNTGASLLDQAEAAGLTPEYGCRMGICFSCTSIKTSGCTKNLRTGELHSDPDQPIQLCISAAVGDVDIQI